MDQQLQDHDQEYSPGPVEGGLLTSWLSKRLLQKKFPPTPKVGLGWWSLINEALKDWNRTPEERMALIDKRWDQRQSLEDRVQWIAKDILPKSVHDALGGDLDRDKPATPREMKMYNVLGGGMLGLAGWERTAKAAQASMAAEQELRSRTPYGPPRPRRSPLDFRPDFAPIPPDQMDQAKQRRAAQMAQPQAGPPSPQTAPPSPPAQPQVTPQPPMGPLSQVTPQERERAFARLAAKMGGPQPAQPWFPQVPGPMMMQLGATPEHMPWQPTGGAPQPAPAPQQAPAPAPQAAPVAPPGHPPPPRRIVRQARVPQAPSAPQASVPASSPMMDMFRRNSMMMRDPATGELIDPGGAARAPRGLLSGLF